MFCIQKYFENLTVTEDAEKSQNSAKNAEFSFLTAENAKFCSRKPHYALTMH